MKKRISVLFLISGLCCLLLIPVTSGKYVAEQTCQIRLFIEEGVPQ